MMRLKPFLPTMPRQEMVAPVRIPVRLDTSWIMEGTILANEQTTQPQEIKAEAAAPAARTASSEAQSKETQGDGVVAMHIDGPPTPAAPPSSARRSVEEGCARGAHDVEERRYRAGEGDERDVLEGSSRCSGANLSAPPPAPPQTEPELDILEFDSFEREQVQKLRIVIDHPQGQDEAPALLLPTAQEPAAAAAPTAGTAAGFSASPREEEQAAQEVCG